MAAPQPARRPQKENIRDFIAKKREIFLVQMSLDTKRAEISKLEVNPFLWRSGGRGGERGRRERDRG